MKNSEHHVWLAFANYRHEGTERIKYLRALRRRSCALQRELTMHLPTPNRGGLGMATSLTSVTSWHASPSWDFPMARAAILQREVYQYFTHSPIFQLSEERSVAEAGLPIPGGALLLGQVKWLGLAGGQFFGTENTSPQTTMLHLCKKYSPALRAKQRP